MPGLSWGFLASHTLEPLKASRGKRVYSSDPWLAWAESPGNKRLTISYFKYPHAQKEDLESQPNNP